MKKFKFKLESQQVRHFGELLANIGHHACQCEVSELEISSLVLGDWYEKKRDKLVFAEAGNYSMNPGEAFALHFLLSSFTGYDYVMLGLDKYVVNERRRRQALYNQIENGEAL